MHPILILCIQFNVNSIRYRQKLLVAESWPAFKGGANIILKHKQMKLWMFYYEVWKINLNSKTCTTLICGGPDPSLVVWGQQRSLKQTLNIWAEVRSVSNFFWNHQFELIFHKFFPKTNRFSSLVTKPLRKFFLEDIFQFLQVFGLNSDSK